MSAGRWIPGFPLAGFLLAGLSWAGALAAPAMAQTSATFKTSGWTGRAAFDAQQQFQYCIVFRSTADGTEYGVRLNPPLQMYIGLSKRDWNMEPSSNYEFTIELGTFRKTYRGAVTADRRNTVWINVGNDADLRRAIAGGGTMTMVDKAGGRFQYNVAGGDNAMRKLLACTALFGVD